MPTYIRYTSDKSLEGPFDSPDLADAYVYDMGCDDSDYELADESSIREGEEIAAPHITFITARIQINNLHASTKATELLQRALEKFNEENPAGASLYLAEK